MQITPGQPGPVDAQVGKVGFAVGAHFLRQAQPDETRMVITDRCRNLLRAGWRSIVVRPQLIHRPSQLENRVGFMDIEGVHHAAVVRAPTGAASGQ